jgi:hypothetical protein
VSDPRPERLTKQAGARTRGAAAVTLAVILASTMVVLLARPYASPALTVPTVTSVATPTVTVADNFGSEATAGHGHGSQSTAGDGARAGAGDPHAHRADPVRPGRYFSDRGSVGRPRIATKPADRSGNRPPVGTERVIAGFDVFGSEQLIVFAVRGFVDRWYVDGHQVGRGCARSARRARWKRGGPAP